VSKRDSRVRFRTCFTRGTMTHLTTEGNKTACGYWTDRESCLGPIDAASQTVHRESACQRSGCRQAWSAWVASGGTIEL